MGQLWGVIVDDTGQQAATSARYLTFRKLNSKSFCDPEEALAFAQSLVHPDAVVFAMFDYYLDGKSGAIYARLFRELGLAREIAVTSANAGNIPNDEVEELRKMGISIHQKPVDPKFVYERFSSLWNLSQPLTPLSKKLEVLTPIEEPLKPQKGRSQDKVAGLTKRRRRIALATSVAVVALLSLFLKTVLGPKPSLKLEGKPRFVGTHGVNRKLIIFVHGLTGDSGETWTNHDTGAYWPQLIDHDPDFNSFDVFVYEYGSPRFGPALDVDEISTQMLQYLKLNGMFSQYDEIDFITHSLGGIVTKQMLNRLHTPDEEGNLRRVHCVIFMAVPSNGSNLAGVAHWFSDNPQLTSLDAKGSAAFLRSLETDWTHLLRVRPPASPFPRTYSAYEKLPTAPGTAIVPELYISEYSDGDLMPMDLDHVQIVKPLGQESFVYKWVKHKIIQCSSVILAGDCSR